MTPVKGEYIIHNNNLLPVSQFNPEIFQGGMSVYEVIRIIDGTALFLEDHLQRFKQSAMLKQKHLWHSDHEMLLTIKQLIASNNITTGNIRIEFVFDNPISPNKHYLAFFVPHRYPSSEEYATGVTTISMAEERPNPNAKIALRSLREKSNNIIHNDNNIYEVILINKNNEITEGSRSNIFFILKDEVLTPPNHAVLCGITREKVLQICKRNNIKLIQQPIKYKDIDKYKAAFLTGTSPMVLPIKQINDIPFPTCHKVLSTIMHDYSSMVDTYIKSKS